VHSKIYRRRAPEDEDRQQHGACRFQIHTLFIPEDTGDHRVNFRLCVRGGAPLFGASLR
jgi:hypothetical protein